VKPAWTAGVTRARLLLSRRIGPGLANTVAGSPSLADGLAALAGSAYGERVRAGQDLGAAERGVADTLLWHLRILAGWLPTAGAALVRALAGWFELVNVDARLAALAGMVASRRHSRSARSPPPGAPPIRRERSRTWPRRLRFRAGRCRALIHPRSWR
jgi:hypothetical protein